MKDNNNELMPAEDNASQLMSRADRIKAIKDSIHSEQPELNDENSNEPYADEPMDDWEKMLAERISRRVQQVKANKSASILADIIAENTDDKMPRVSEDAFNERESEPESEFDSDHEITEDSEVISSASEQSSVSEIPEPENDVKIPNDSHNPDSSNITSEPIEKESPKKKKKTFKERLLGFFPQKQDKLSERIRKIVFLGSCVAIVVCGSMVLSYYIDTIHTQNVYDDIESVYIDYNSTATEPTEPTEEVEIYTPFSWAEQLLKQNKDLVGYLTIPGSISDPEAQNEIAYPVVQSDDLEKYLHTSFNGEEARAGTLFLDYRNKYDKIVDGKMNEENSDNLIVYGHNMQDGNMFGKLKNYRNNYSYYSEHPVITFDSNYNHYQYKIFAVFIVDAEDKTDTAFDCWNRIDFSGEDDFYDFVNEAKRRTIIMNDVDVKYGDKLLTLSTCNTIFGNDGPGRLIVLARMIREGEDPYEGTQNSWVNNNIKWPSLYYTYNSNEKYDPDAEFIPYGETVPEKTTKTEE